MANYRQKWFDNNESNYGWYRCVRCGKALRKGDVDIDHIIPQSRGGGHSLNNLQCMCRTCNRSKRNDVGLHTAKDYTRNTLEVTSKTLSGFLSRLSR